MAEITAVFSDLGGVVLTNGWEINSRIRAAARFGLDRDDLEKRHRALFNDLETGKLGFDEYLRRTVFYQPRPFTLEEFKDFIFGESALAETSEVIFGLSQSRKYLMATLNNESLELNLYRIRRFGLRNYFSVFFSSCFVGMRKPDPGIYRMALRITQRSPSESLFIDDRIENVEGAKQAGMHAIQCRDTAQLRQDLERLGVVVEPAPAYP